MFAATAIAILLILIDLSSGGGVRSQVRAGVALVWNAGVSVNASIFSNGYFSSRRSLSSENEALREQLAQYSQRAAAYDVLVRENESLRALAQIAGQESGITAPIISPLSGTPFSTFQIGAGADEVAVGDMVLTDGGFVVGIVSDVAAQSALVTELFAANHSVDVHIAETRLVAEGYGGGNARATTPRGVAIVAGDSVTAPSLGARAVGVVGSVKSDPASAEQTVYIRLPANLSSLRFVYVVRAN
jgi:cell shape-determining protein MreC